jgi:hypothetical protein
VRHKRTALSRWISEISGVLRHSADPPSRKRVMTQ